jgi:hypothetical protein
MNKYLLLAALAGTHHRTSEWKHFAEDAPQCGSTIMADELAMLNEMKTFRFDGDTLAIAEWSEQYIWSAKAQAYISASNGDDGLWVAGFVAKPGIISFQLQHVVGDKLACADNWMAQIQ